MAKITEAQKQEFEQKLFEMFPDVQTSNQVTRSQLLAVRETMGNPFHPLWLMQTQLGRGLYAIPGGSVTQPMARKPVTEYAETPAKKMESVVVDFTDTESLIPRLDANYVAFGNHKDLEQIISSKQFYPAYISGPTGNGKSTTIEQICAKQRRALIRVNLNTMTDEDQLIVTKTLMNNNVDIF